jgi:hypothetical protein
MAIAPTFTLGQAESLIRVLSSDIQRRKAAVTPIVSPHPEGPGGELKDLEEAHALLSEAITAPT